MTDPYYKKTATYKHIDKTLKFNLSQSLFSSQKIDHGTQRLLRTFIFTKYNRYKKILDVGCGVGSIGLSLKSAVPEATLHMVDRDALAIKYAMDNAKLNNLTENVSAYGSLGYDSVKDKDFDLIVSNIPAKIGESALIYLLKNAQSHLTKDGRVMIVVVDAINDLIKKTLKTDRNIEILFKRSWPGHHVYHYKFLSDKNVEKQSKAFESGEFFKQENSFEIKGRELTLKTSHNLPDFDELSFDTRKTLKRLKKLKGNPSEILLLNPGQGYIPLALTRRFSINNLTIVDRDLLALKTTKENLLRYNFPEDNLKIKHQSDLNLGEGKYDLIVAVIPEKQNLEVYSSIITQINDVIKPAGQVLLSSSSTVITRVQDIISKTTSLIYVFRERFRGRSILIVKDNT